MKTLLLILILFSCTLTEVNPDIFGTYNDGDSGILIVNEAYINYCNVWHTQEYELTQDSLKFHVSIEVQTNPGNYVTWWFELQIGKDVLQGNNYKTVNFNPDFREERGLIYFTKL